jgi:hypothetical protein
MVAAHFTPGSSVYTCYSCGKRTRIVGDETEGACNACYEEQGIINEHDDTGGDHSLYGDGRPSIDPNCPSCKEESNNVNETIETVGQMRKVLKTPGIAVYVTSTIFLGGGVSFKVTKEQVYEQMKGRPSDARVSDETDVYYDADTNSVYL